MPEPAPFIAYGQTQYWAPGLRTQKRIGALDTLTGTYIADEPSPFSIGHYCPDYPGMLIDDITEIDDGAGSWEYRISAVGNLQADRPRKFISDRKTRSNDPVWDTSVRDLYHDCVDEFTGTTNVGFNGVLGNHRFDFWDPVIILSVAAPCGLTAGALYYVSHLNGGVGFRLATTILGPAVTITANVAVTLAHRDFVRGQPHPKHPGMFLADVDSDQDDLLPWSRARCSYRGIYGSKPYKRTITVNGRQVGFDNTIWSFPGGGWGTSRKGQFKLPTVQVADVQVYATDPNLYQYLPTSDVLNYLEESGRDIPAGIVIPDPPDVSLMFAILSGSEVSQQWPCYWGFDGCERVDEIPGTSVVMIRKIWTFNAQLTL